MNIRQRGPVSLFVILTVILLAACGDNGNIPQGEIARGEVENEVSIFEKNNIEENTYYSSFESVFTPEEYVDLCNTLRPMSATPALAISEFCFIANVEEATYNTCERMYVLMDISGNVLKDYGVNENGFCPVKVDEVGEYHFVGNYGDSVDFDILDDHGNIVATLHDTSDIIHEVSDLGDNYYIFAVGGYAGYKLYILNPDGEYHMISRPSQIDYPLDYERLMNEAEIGRLSEGLFFMRYETFPNTCAFYCNTLGEKVIDLTSSITNYHVTKLDDFSNSKARIDFDGADGNKYYVTINPKGDFLHDPVRLEE